MNGRVATAALLMLTTGCATVLSSKEHDYAFNSTPGGAQVYVDGNPVGTTPARVNLSNTTSHTVTFKKEGYADIGCVLDKGTGAGWVILDVLFGVVPVVIDAATDNWSQTKRREYRDGNPVARTARPKADPRDPVILTDEQYDALLAACGDRSMLRFYVLVLGEAGLRCESEALWLRWSDIRLDEAVVHVASGRNGHRTKERKESARAHDAATGDSPARTPRATSLRPVRGDADSLGVPPRDDATAIRRGRSHRVITFRLPQRS